jgi:tetratricopeptide (TPR) repeat protein
MRTSSMVVALVLAIGIPEALQAFESAAVSACRQGDPSSRVAGCSSLLTLARTPRQRAIALDGRCWANNDRQNYAAAIPDCATAIQADPSYPYSHHNRGIALAGLGEHRAAVAAFTKAIELRPAVAYQFVNRARSLQQIGDRQGAIRNFEAALRLQPGNADAKLGLVSSAVPAQPQAHITRSPASPGSGNSLCGASGCM